VHVLDEKDQGYMPPNAGSPGDASYEEEQRLHGGCSLGTLVLLLGRSDRKV